MWELIGLIIVIVVYSVSSQLRHVCFCARSISLHRFSRTSSFFRAALSQDWIYIISSFPVRILSMQYGVENQDEYSRIGIIEVTKKKYNIKLESADQVIRATHNLISDICSTFVPLPIAVMSDGYAKAIVNSHVSISRSDRYAQPRILSLALMIPHHLRHHPDITIWNQSNDERYRNNGNN